MRNLFQRTLVAMLLVNATSPAAAAQDGILQELDATEAPRDPNAYPTTSVGDWQVTTYRPQHCTAWIGSFRADEQSVSLERDRKDYWITFISDQPRRRRAEASGSFPVSRDTERGGSFVDFTYVNVGTQRGYRLKLDRTTRAYFAGGTFFTLLANIDDDTGDTRADTYLVIGIKDALAALDAC